MTRPGAHRGGVLHRLKGDRSRLSFDEWVARAEEELAVERAKQQKSRAEIEATYRRLDREWEKVRTEHETIRVECKSSFDGIEGRLIVAEAVVKAAVAMALDVHTATSLTQAKSAAANLHHVLAWARKQNGIVASAVEAHSLSRVPRGLPTDGLRLRIAALRHRIYSGLHDRSVQVDTSYFATDPPRLEVCHGRPVCATAPFAFCVVAMAQSRLEADGFVSADLLFAEIEEIGKRRKLNEGEAK